MDASIEAVHQATISAQVSGRITEMAVDVDDYVAKGAIIVRLYDKEQQAAAQFNTYYPLYCPY